MLFQLVQSVLGNVVDVIEILAFLDASAFLQLYLVIECHFVAVSDACNQEIDLTLVSVQLGLFILTTLDKCVLVRLFDGSNHIALHHDNLCAHI